MAKWCEGDLLGFNWGNLWLLGYSLGKPVLALMFPTVAFVISYSHCSLYEPVSGRRMSVHSTQPGVQLYTGNFLPADGAPPFTQVCTVVTNFQVKRIEWLDKLIDLLIFCILQHNALCLETQHYPNAVNTAGFPSVLLRPGERYRQLTTHAFSWSWRNQGNEYIDWKIFQKYTKIAKMCMCFQSWLASPSDNMYTTAICMCIHGQTATVVSYLCDFRAFNCRLGHLNNSIRCNYKWW